MNWQQKVFQLICERGITTTDVEGPEGPTPKGKKRDKAVIRYTKIDPDELVKSQTKGLGGDVKGAQTKVSHFLGKIRKGKIKGKGRTFVQKGSHAFGRGVLGLEHDPAPVDPTSKAKSLGPSRVKKK